MELPPSEAHHVLRVLRGRSGDPLEVVDARGRLFVAKLREGPGAVIVEELAVSGGVDTDISLYQAVPKGQRMELVVEKAVELGVAGVVPIVTERGEVRAKKNKLERWRRVAQAAARQSLQLRVPVVRDPRDFSEVLREADAGVVVLHNGDNLPMLEDVLSSGSNKLCVGPEGGWSENELDLARQTGIALARLGPYRLRSETAGIVAVARAQAALQRATRASDA